MGLRVMHDRQIVRLRAATCGSGGGLRFCPRGWDDAVQDARFEQKFVLEEVRIIVVNGEDAGYLQTAVKADHFALKELHIDEAFQNCGIGTEVLRLLFVEARRIAKPMTVTVVNFNPALAFYERAGFRVVSQQDQRFHLRHESQK